MFDCEIKWRRVKRKSHRNLLCLISECKVKSLSIKWVYECVSLGQLKWCVPFGQRVKCLLTWPLIAGALLVSRSWWTVAQLCPVIYLFFDCAPCNPICDQQVAPEARQLWLQSECWVGWFASGLALMFCYCYLHKAVQPLTAGLLFFYYFLISCQHFYKVILIYFWLLFFSWRPTVFNIPWLFLKTTKI